MKKYYELTKHEAQFINSEIRKGYSVQRQQQIVNRKRQKAKKLEEDFVRQFSLRPKKKVKKDQTGNVKLTQFSQKPNNNIGYQHGHINEAGSDIGHNLVLDEKPKKQINTPAKPQSSFIYHGSRRQRTSKPTQRLMEYQSSMKSVGGCNTFIKLKTAKQSEAVQLLQENQQKECKNQASSVAPLNSIPKQPTVSQRMDIESPQIMKSIKQIQEGNQQQKNISKLSQKKPKEKESHLQEQQFNNQEIANNQEPSEEQEQRKTLKNQQAQPKSQDRIISIFSHYGNIAANTKNLDNKVVSDNQKQQQLTQLQNEYILLSQQQQNDPPPISLDQCEELFNTLRTHSYSRVMYTSPQEKQHRQDISKSQTSDLASINTKFIIKKYKHQKQFFNDMTELIKNKLLNHLLSTEQKIQVYQFNKKYKELRRSFGEQIKKQQQKQAKRQEPQELVTGTIVDEQKPNHNSTNVNANYHLQKSAQQKLNQSHEQSQQKDDDKSDNVNNNNDKAQVIQNKIKQEEEQMVKKKCKIQKQQKKQNKKKQQHNSQSQHTTLLKAKSSKIQKTPKKQNKRNPQTSGVQVSKQTKQYNYQSIYYKSPIMISEREKLFSRILSLPFAKQKQVMQYSLKVLPSKCFQKQTSQAQQQQQKQYVKDRARVENWASAEIKAKVVNESKVDNEIENDVENKGQTDKLQSQGQKNIEDNHQQQQRQDFQQLQQQAAEQCSSSLSQSPSQLACSQIHFCRNFMDLKYATRKSFKCLQLYVYLKHKQLEKNHQICSINNIDQRNQENIAKTEEYKTTNNIRDNLISNKIKVNEQQN